MPSALARRKRAVGLVSILLFAVCAVATIQTANFGRAAGYRSHISVSAVTAFHRSSDRWHQVETSTTTTAAPPTTTTTTTTPPRAAPQAPAATTPTTTLPPLSPAPVATIPPAGATQPPGQASVWGCSAAIAYLSAYAYPGFTFECPGDAMGRDGMTCLNEPGICPGQAVIAIADACPATYMNEASNSWVLEGRSTAPIDPYGTC